MSLYTEQYDAAAPLIASLLWSPPREQPIPTVKQLKSLNTQIQVKTNRNRRRQDDGTLDLDLFTWLRDQIKEAAATYHVSRDAKKFGKAQAKLNERSHQKLSLARNLEH
jgi:hypothetical protein